MPADREEVLVTAHEGPPALSPCRKVWELRYRQAVALKLAARIVKENGIQ